MSNEEARNKGAATERAKRAAGAALRPDKPLHRSLQPSRLKLELRESSIEWLPKAAGR
jgi:hypothetical protein